LQRSGRSYKASCPFHQEKTPSFYVFPDRQSWRCFGACATGGDVFSFVMKAESLEFGEVLSRLAQQAGVTLPSREKRTEQQSALEINEAARAYFQHRLASAQGAEARAYLESRGLERRTIEKFELGLSPRDGEALKNHLVKQGFSLEQLAQAGVVAGGENGRPRDLFRHRLMIPIRNGQGELGGFGGRALDDSNPKYLNSPRTPVFDKGRILYALYLAKDAIRQNGAVVVEGYMDAIMAHQHGFNNVVASMGTALTEHQVAEIRRLTGSVIMALDADAAGQQATLNSLRTSWQIWVKHAVGQANGMTMFRHSDNPEPKIAALPSGMDPDEVIRRSPAEWDKLTRESVSIFEFLMPALSKQVDIATPQGKALVAREMYPLIAAVAEPIQQDYYFQKLAHHLRVSEDTLRASMGRFAAGQGRERPSRRQAAPGAAGRETPDRDSAFVKLEHDPIEEHCLARLLQNPRLYEAIPELKPEYFRRPENREMVKYVAHAASDGFDESAMEWLQQTVDQELAPHLEYLLGKALPTVELHHQRAALRDSVSRLEERYLRELKAEEALRFSEAPLDGLLEGEFEETLEINQRFKKNELVRNYLAQNVSDRR